MLVQLRSADVSCEEATLRTHPLSGQAAINSLLGRTKPIACHSGAAFEGSGWLGGAPSLSILITTGNFLDLYCGLGYTLGFLSNVLCLY